MAIGCESSPKSIEYAKGFLGKSRKMPIYEFQCDACGRTFEELFRSPSERRRPKCPKCKSPDVHKRFSTFAMGGAGGGGGGCASCAGGHCATCH
jgi:putative FmdB family regulatory protein